MDSSLRWNDKVGAVIPVKTGIHKTIENTGFQLSLE